MRNNKIINFFLESKWLMHLGKISYGVYLYHLFIPELWSVINKVFSGWGIDLFFNQKMPAAFRTPWIFLQEFAFLLLMSIVSWKFIEQPINRLKIYFENQKELRNKTTLEKEASK